jgi:16S rRNA (cytidine1402-2'-O)-methyltransferase
VLYFIPTPIGNLEDISQRSLRLLSSLPMLFCEDTRVTKQLLKLLSERYNLEICAKKFISLHSHNEEKVLENLDKSLFEQDCAYVSDAGMPGISDPGTKLIQYAQKNKIPYEVLPGSNAALLAYVSSGFENSKFLFWGFLPSKEKALIQALKTILSHPYPTIVYEAPHRIKKSIELLASLEPEREVFLIKEATKKHEKHFKGSALHVKEQLSQSNLKGEWVIVVKQTKKSYQQNMLDIDDILPLSLPPKEKAKLLSKLTNESTKEWYLRLQKEN